MNDHPDIEKTFIFKVKVDPLGFTTNDISCDSDGYMLIATKNPAIIYDKIRIEDVISVEKISNGYIFR